MRLVAAPAVLAASTPDALAQNAWRLKNAVYAERDNGYELRFHKGKP
jgi:hypothetical protein